MDGDVGQKELNALRKTVDKFKYKKFFKNLREKHKSSKQLKAAKYYNY